MEADAAGKSSLQRAAAKLLAAKIRSDAESNARRVLNEANAKVAQLKND